MVRALANAPKIVLADEPSGNLDRRSGEEVFTLMREMNRDSGAAFIMITHDDRLAQTADRILLIEDGVLRDVMLANTNGHPQGWPSIRSAMCMEAARYRRLHRIGYV